VKVINQNKVKSIENVCGTIKELYSSPDLSLSIAAITGKSTPHMHKKMEEIYFVLKGEGEIFIGDESEIIKRGDLVAIPKNKFHYIQAGKGKTIEIMVATHPGFDPDDVIEKMS
jgi:mannose-6-phosphate isomerase-like protein (cupin superfamily)